MTTYAFDFDGSEHTIRVDGESTYIDGVAYNTPNPVIALMQAFDMFEWDAEELWDEAEEVEEVEEEEEEEN
jgi:hypothetical protein